MIKNNAPKTRMPRVIVIGGGAAGMIAAGRAAECGADVLLLEKTDKTGNKIRITGKGRCNITNSQDLDAFMSAYGLNGRFLHGAFSRFFSGELIYLLKHFGVEVKKERGGRIFPTSDKATDVTLALMRYLENGKVEVIYNAKVKNIIEENGQVIAVETDDEKYEAQTVILAAGGASYPATGSSGDGFILAEKLGHSVTRVRGALVPLIVEEIDLAKSMQGVSLKNVRLSAYSCHSSEIPENPITQDYVIRGSGKKPKPPLIESRMGEMMFTHFGVGGPITLLGSLAVTDALTKGKVSISIDLKPALSPAELCKRLQREFEKSSKRSFRNTLKTLLPQKMLGPIIKLCGISPDAPAYKINAAQRDSLAKLLKGIKFNIKNPLPLGYAMVTAGGIKLNEINPKTMESKLVKGLYVCGEVLDIDGETGGYNLQAAFSTGYVAGTEAAKSLGF